MSNPNKGACGIDGVTPCRKDSIEARDLDGEAILYNPDTKHVHILNKAALQVWQMCDGQHSIRDMAVAIAEMYSLSPGEREGARVEQDIQRIIDDFAAQGMIVKQDEDEVSTERQVRVVSG
ncbi:MAG: PqqD family protein [bacterium]